MDLNKKIRMTTGMIVSLAIVLIPAYAWKFGYDFSGLEGWEVVVLSFAKVGAFGGMAMFALSLVLSGRYRVYDKLFGGLDKMYIAHRFFGTFSLILLLIHPLALTLLRPGERLALWFDVTNIGVWIGTISLYSLLAISIWSIFAHIKYETFLVVHRYLGVAFLVGATHAFVAGSVLQANSFMFYYMLVLSVAAVVTFLLYSVGGDVLHRAYNYRVKNITNDSSGVTAITLTPNSRAINYQPGQFVYIMFDQLQQHGYHPFSISSNRRGVELSLAIRRSGDFTTALRDIKPGAIAKVKGPHGGFILPHRSKKKQLWIAGGIGIAPFLSGIKSLNNRPSDPPIELIYATDDDQPYGLQELETAESYNRSFNVTLFEQSTFGYVTFETLQKNIKDLAERDIYICGPPGMLHALVTEARAHGLEDNLHYEEFDY